MIAPEARELYRGKPEGFIAARDALVKRLRDEGRDADAAELKKLRRPTVAAWVLDRLADEAPAAIGELLDAGADLARAQRATLSGRDPRSLRDATTRRRELVARLSRAAAGVLRDVGRSPDQHLEDIRGTLDRTVRRSAGFGDLAGLQLVSRRDDEPEEVEPARSRSRIADDHAERKAAAAEGARSRLAEQVASMQTRLDAAGAKLRDAEASSAEQRMNAKRAAKEFDAADRKLRDAPSSKR